MKKKPLFLNLSNVHSEMDDASWLEVRCLKAATKFGSVIRGEWTLQLATEDEGDVHKIPVVNWRSSEAKTIKTIPGLAALAMTLGIRSPEIPLCDGDTGIWKRVAGSSSPEQHTGATE